MKVEKDKKIGYGLSKERLKSLLVEMVTYCMLNFDWDKETIMRKLEITEKEFDSLYK